MQSCISPRQYAILICSMALICSGLTMDGQKNISVVNDILKKSIFAGKHPSHANSQSIINDLDYKLPLLEKVEIRTQTERLTLARQEFLIRTSFNTIGLRDAISAERKAYLTMENMENNAEVRKKLYSTYRQLIDLSALIYQQQAQAAILIQYKIHIALFEKMLAAGEAVDLADYLHMKKELLFVEAKASEDSQKIVALNTWLGNEKWPGDTLVILTVEDASHIIDMLDWNTEKHYITEENKAKLSYLESAYLTEKAKSKKILDFVQLGYTVRQDLLPENRFTLGMGFQLPWKGSSKIGLNDLITKRENTEKESLLFEESTKEKYEQLESTFKIKVDLYRQLMAISNDEKTLALQKTIIDSGRLSPMKQMTIKEDELKLQAKIKDLQSEIYYLYLELLDTSGILYVKPYKNYLHPLMPAII